MFGFDRDPHLLARRTLGQGWLKLVLFCAGVILFAVLTAIRSDLYAFAPPFAVPCS
jgi:hypothetical protein